MDVSMPGLLSGEIASPITVLFGKFGNDSVANVSPILFNTDYMLIVCSVKTSFPNQFNRVYL